MKTLSTIWEGRKFTPFGVLQNVDHVWPKKPSGVVRSLEALRFGWLVNFWWFITPKNAVYIASLGVAVRVGDKLFHMQKDFEEEGVELYSNYHTKNIISQKWEYEDLVFECAFTLLDGNTLVCLFTAENKSGEMRTINVYGIGDLSYKGKSMSIGINDEIGCAFISLLGKDDYDRRLNLIMSGSLRPKKILFSRSLKETRNITKGGYSPGCRDLHAQNYVAAIMEYMLEIPANSVKKLAIILHRTEDLNGGCKKISKLFNNLREVYEAKVREDADFWEKGVQLVGDWPESWKNGFIYDFETLRMMVFPSRGVFKHKWDIMHVNWPRNVVAEASIDMLMLSYSDPATAKEVLYGLFSDALAPNVPCVHADGTFNMVADDGSRCGTSPAWCLPFYSYLLIYERNGDVDWLRKMYPLWKSFLVWWLEERVDEEGFLHYKCSWESGEDNAPRYGIKGGKGGESIEHIRVVELQAVMAHAARCMRYYAKILGLGEKEDNYWSKIEEKYKTKLSVLWHHEWYHDYDLKEEDFTPYTDPLHMTPIFMDLVDEEKYLHLLRDPQLLLKRFRKSVGVNTLDWPSLTYPFFEAVLKASEKTGSLIDFLSDTAFRLVSIIYSAEDSRRLRRNRPLPGVSYEKWEWPELKFGGVEGYGWGAFTIVILLRYLLGFQETLFTDGEGFRLYPNLPSKFMSIGGRYGVKNLKYRGLYIDLSYHVLENNKLDATLFIRSSHPQKLSLLDREGSEIKRMVLHKGFNSVKAVLKNKNIYTVALMNV
ncbi:MAG: hypothetical protein DRJ47_08280 [Thermoprotei archaeon]|nr:MAG: hypothetical protein DRJ47_08280 [Thermoprotei archaeon]